jgi:hypothetical protein
MQSARVRGDRHRHHRAHVLTQLAALYDEVAAMREACGEAHMKAILATGDLKTLRNVYKASMVAMQAGADFIKTSTGKEDVNATLPVSLVMVRALSDYPRTHRLPTSASSRPAAFDREGRAQLADPDEGGTRPPLAGARSLPHRRLSPCWPISSASSNITSPAATRPPPPRRWPEDR